MSSKAILIPRAYQQHAGGDKLRQSVKTWMSMLTCWVVLAKGLGPFSAGNAFFLAVRGPVPARAVKLNFSRQGGLPECVTYSLEARRGPQTGLWEANYEVLGGRLASRK